MNWNVLGISGSPIREGNVDAFLNHMLETAQNEGLKTDSIYLSRLNIQECVHCNFCLRKQKSGKYCSLEDDGQRVFEKFESADIVVLASPVYFMRTSARLAALIDRLRVFIFGNLAGGRLRNKIGVSAAVSWLRHGGIETTHLSHLYAFMTLDMIPVGLHDCLSPLGAAAVASAHGEGRFDPATRLGIMADRAGLQSGEAIMRRAIELVGLING